MSASTAPVKSEISFSGGLPLCGTTACDLTKNICCVTQTAQGSCIPNTQTCPSGDATFKCVQKTDCPGNDICCGVANESTSSAGSQCEDVSSTNQECTPVATGASSTQGSAQVCQTTAKCKNGMTCQWQTCNVSGALIEPQLTMCGIQSAAPFNCTAHP